MRAIGPHAEARADPQEALIDLIYGAVRDQRAWQEVLRELRRLVAADAVALGRHDLATRSGACLDQVGLDPVLAARYETELAGKDTWMPAIGRYQAHAVVTGEDILPNVDPMRTEFYQEYLRPQQLLHWLCGIVCRRDAEFWYLTAARQPARPGFGDTDKSRLGRLLPHIQRALELSWELAHERGARHVLLDVLDQLPTAIVVVDAQARPVMINAAAEAILALGDGMLVSSKRLGALWHAEGARLAQLIASACGAAANGGSAGAGGHLTITRPSGFRPFLVIVSPLPRADYDDVGRRRPVAAVVIKDLQAEPPTSAASRREIAKLYELTPAEERLLDLILDGSGLFEAAEQLGVSRNTARTHMKRIYAKTGTRRQAELVRRLAHLTSIG
jgi:DNA-binding CsgD family transcriptional regulator/PAS domain-containing protein